MADKTVSIKVAAKGASEFKSQMGQCAGAVKALNAESKAIQAEFKATGNEQQYLEKTYANLTKKIEQQRKMVDAAKQALAKLAKDGFGPNSKEVQEWSVSLSKAQASVFETQAAINDTVARAHELGGSFESVGSQADEAAGQTAKVGQSFDTSGVKGSVDEVTKTVDKADDSAGEAKEGIDQIGGSIEDSGLNSSVETIDATIQSADDSAAETKAGIDEIGGDVDSSDLSGSVSEIDAEIQSADDSVAEVKGEIDTMGEGVDIGDLSSSVTDIDTEIQRADDSVDTVRDVIGTLGDEVSTEGIDTSATAIDTAVQGADDSVPEAKAEIASLGEEFDTSGAEGSAEAVHEKIVWAAEGAGTAKDDIAGVGEGFDTSGVEGSAGDVKDAVDEIDGDGAHDELEKIGQTINTQAVLSSLQTIEKGIEGVIKKAASAAKGLFQMGADAGAWADELITSASQMGIDTQTLQQMRGASAFIDTDVSAIESGMKRIAQNRDTQAWMDNLKELEEMSGVSIALEDESGARASLDVLLDIVDALATIDSYGEREQIASDLLGRSWNDFNPMVDAGGGRAYKKQMEEINVVAEENVQALGNLDDANQKAQQDLAVLKETVMAELAPAFEAGAKALSEFATKMQEFVQSETGQAALTALSEAMTNLISAFTSEENLETVFDLITKGVESLTGALNWFSENGEAVKGIIEGIGTAFGLIKVSETALTFMQLAQGAKNLFGGGGVATAAKAALPAAIEALPAALAAGSVVAGGYLIHNFATASDRMYGDYDAAMENYEAVGDAVNQQIEQGAQKAEQLRAQAEAAEASMREMGDTGEDVKAAQQMLADAGYDLGDKGVDGIRGENTQAAIDQYIADMRAEADAAEAAAQEQAGRYEHIQQMLADAKAVMDLQEDPDATYGDFVDASKEYFAKYGEELATMFDDIDFNQSIKDVFGELNFDPEEVFGNESILGGGRDALDTYASQAATHLLELLASDVEAGGGTVDAAATSIASQASTTAQTDLESGGQTGGEGFDNAIAAAIASNAAIVQAAAAQLGAEAAMAFDAAYRSSVGAPAGYSGGGRHSQSTGSQNVQIIMELDGQQIGEAVAPVVDQRIGTSAKRRP